MYTVTCWRESKLSTGHASISSSPEVVTHCAPLGIVTHLHSTLKSICPSDKPDVSSCTNCENKREVDNVHAIIHQTCSLLRSFSLTRCRNGGLALHLCQSHSVISQTYALETTATSFLQRVIYYWNVCPPYCLEQESTRKKTVRTKKWKLAIANGFHYAQWISLCHCIISCVLSAWHTKWWFRNEKSISSLSEQTNQMHLHTIFLRIDAALE